MWTNAVVLILTTAIQLVDVPISLARSIAPAQKGTEILGLGITIEADARVRLAMPVTVAIAESVVSIMDSQFASMSLLYRKFILVYEHRSILLQGSNVSYVYTRVVE